MKRCTRCGITKNLADFYNDRLRPDGKSCHCKACKKRICLDGQKATRKYVKASKQYEKALIEIRSQVKELADEFTYLPVGDNFNHILLVIDRALQ